MTNLDIYAQFVIIDANGTRFVPPHPRPLLGITSALDGHTGFLKPGEASDSGSMNILVNSLKIKETVTILRHADTFSADVSYTYYNKLPTMLVVEFDLIDGSSIDFWTLVIFQAKIRKYEIHTPDVEHAANGEKIMFDFAAADVKFSKGVNRELSQYGLLRQPPRTTEAERRRGLA